MSYVRFGADSDVYLIGTTITGDIDVIECCGCKFTWDDGPAQFFHAIPDVLAHLDQHRAAGHKVPDEAYAEVRADDWLGSEGER